MPDETVFETSETVPSPSGAYTVAVSSQTFLPEGGLSQAVVSEPNGGSGLIAFHSSRVSMGFEWKSDDELIVRYPDDLPAPRIDATNRSFGRGGGRVIYEAVPRAEIRPLRWMREGVLRTTGEELCERGVLLTFETDEGVEYSYSYSDVHEADSSSEELQARGLQGGGATWAGIVHGLVVLRAPELVEWIEIDPEADGLSVHSTRREALVTLARLVADAKREPALLEAALDQARSDGQLE